MSVEVTYQLSGCVLIVPQYVPGIVTNPKIRETVGSRHTQLLDTADAELVVYGELQLVNIKQAPPQQASVAVNQAGNVSMSQLIRVAQVAFALALKDQGATAVGINLNATATLSKQNSGVVIQKLLAPKILTLPADGGGTLKGGGIKLIYDKKPWVATITIESDPNNAAQVACVVNFNIDKPAKGQVTLIQHDADSLRGWFERTVKEVVGGDSNA